MNLNQCIQALAAGLMVISLSGLLGAATVPPGQDKNPPARAPLQDVIELGLQRAKAQYGWLLRDLPDHTNPRTFENGKLVSVASGDWTSGFFPGALWYLYEATGEEKWREAAARRTVSLEREQFNRKTHDLGFMLYCSYGNGLRLAGPKEYRPVLLNAAASLAARFDPKVGAIRSWDHGTWSFPVIIDNLMNLELLFWAAREAGEPHYREIAVAHAETTLKHHFRPDASCYHVVDFDPASGRALKYQTHQGIADSSAWARGQAWALYGYTMLYRETRDARYLAQAERVAEFILNHPRMPADKVPFWDFDDPAIPNAPRDSSAAAIMASALLELGDYASPANRTRYSFFAEEQLRALASPAYRAEEKTNGGFLLKHATGNHPKGKEIDVPLNYADYYFLEALLRAKARFSSPPAREWSDVPAILARIRVPEFPQRDFEIATYGAKGDSVTDSLPALRAAIAECHAAGGGRVVVAAGTYLLNGPIHLKSNVNLHLAEGSTLLFSGQPEHFLPVVLTRWEGTILYNYSPLIYARGAENIAITGRGVIDGNARKEFHKWAVGSPRLQAKDQERSRRMNAMGVPIAERVFGEGSLLRPSMIQPYECRNVLIEGVTIKDSPFWVIHPTFCTNVTVRGVTVESLLINNDGCNPDSSTDVLIEDCDFHTGDDGIAIKAGRDQDAWRDGRISENIVIRNCRFRSKINGLCIGSEMAGGVRSVFMEDCRVETGESCIYFKSNRDRGGFIENVRVRRIQVGVSQSAVIRFETNYHSYRGGKAPTLYRDFVIEDLTVGKAAAYMLFAEGTEERPMQGILLRNVVVEQAAEPLFLRNVQSLRLDNVRVNGVLLPETPAPTAQRTPRLEMRM